jgi:hypothetical protein
VEFGSGLSLKFDVARKHEADSYVGLSSNSVAKLFDLQLWSFGVDFGNWVLSRCSFWEWHYV